MANTQEHRVQELTDPLSQSTRISRRNLLGMSALAIVSVHTGLMPTQISGLGITFSDSDQRALVSVMILGLIYFFLAFLLYAASDFLAWSNALLKQEATNLRKRKLNVLCDELDLSVPITEVEIPKDYPKERLDDIKQIFSHLDFSVEEELARRSIVFRKAVRPLSALRGAFDFVMPIIFGAYAIVALFGLA